MDDWRDVETDDPPPYGVDVWIHRCLDTAAPFPVPVVIAHRALADGVHDEWRAYDGTTYHNVAAWAPIVPPAAPVRVVRWETPKADGE